MDTSLVLDSYQSLRFWSEPKVYLFLDPISKRMILYHVRNYLVTMRAAIV